MNETKRRRILVGGLMLVAACVFLPGIRWGLPSRAVDPYLFGKEPPWSGEKILSLAGGWDEANIGADVDRNPLGSRSQPLLLNQTDAQRAEIIRRYRLFSHQPDEMITFRALSQMQPGQLKLDPKLYQYGGLWMYPVGAMLKAASMTGLIQLRGDLAFYLDHPEAFGRFYVVARLYTVLWGLIGVWAVFWITRRMAGGLLLPAATATICYILMPVVVNMAHEAKPHLPGAVLMLLAIIAAMKFVETGATRWWIFTGILCGAALGMVISSLIGFVILPTMTLPRPDPWRRRITITAAACAIGGAVYALTNPYVPINFFTNYELLQSNIGNSTAMYGVGRFSAFVVDGLRLMIEGLSPPLMLAGVAGTVMMLRHRGSGIGWLLAAPALVVTAQFFALAAGKPPEYARFALLPDIALAIAAAVGLSRVDSARWRAGLAAALVLFVLPFGARYAAAFVRDVGRGTRLAAAEDLRSIPGPLYLLAEPAPYSVPPIDLLRRKLVLVPSAGDAPRGEGILLRSVDDPIDLTSHGDVGLPLRNGRPGFFETAPISWASKTFAIRYLRDVGG